MQNIHYEEKDWKRWNIRVPLVLFLFGANATLYQFFPNLFLFENAFMAGAQYIRGIVTLFLLCEIMGMNQKKIHFTFGILIIILGLLLDKALV